MRTRSFRRSRVPTYTGAGWYGYTYKTHLAGAQTLLQQNPAPKKMLFTGPAHPDRPLRALRGEMLRWYDHWLKGIDNGIMEEPPVTYWVMGANQWRHGGDWPLPETQWTKLYLAELGAADCRALSRRRASTTTSRRMSSRRCRRHKPTGSQKLRFLTDPLPHDVLVAGPSVLRLFAAIDQDDTNWIVTLKDVGPDPSVRTAREGEREIPHRFARTRVDPRLAQGLEPRARPERSKPWKPWHKLTRAGAKKVKPGKIEEYADRNCSRRPILFRKGHRICVEITEPRSMRPACSARPMSSTFPTTSCSSRTVVHSIYHDAGHPSHLLLPVIPVAEPSLD